MNMFEFFDAEYRRLYEFYYQSGDLTGEEFMEMWHHLTKTLETFKEEYEYSLKQEQKELINLEPQ